MGKLIIDNQSDVTDILALEMVKHVLHEGRISGTGDKAQYCYATTFQQGEVCIYATLNKKSDKFLVVSYRERR